MRGVRGLREDKMLPILKDYFTAESQNPESLFENLKEQGLLSDKWLWTLLDGVQGVDQSFRGKVFDALMANGVKFEELEFYKEDEKEFLSKRIGALLDEGKKDEVEKLLPAYATYHAGAKDKVLYNRLMEDPELGAKLIQSTTKLFSIFRHHIRGHNHAEALVKHELVTPDILVACYAEYLLQREQYLGGDHTNAPERVSEAEGSFRILQLGLLKGKEALEGKTAYEIAIGKFLEEGGRRDYGGLVEPNEELPTASDIIKNYDIEVLNSIIQVRRKGSVLASEAEMTITERIIATLQECINFIFGGGVRKEIADAVRNELGMQNKAAERGGRQ